MAQLPAAPFFDAFIPSFEAGMLKPDRRIGQSGLEALGVDAGVSFKASPP